MDVTVDGYRVHAATGSREPQPGAPAVIFIHGAGLDRTLWQLQTRHVAHRGRRALALDLPGHGRSEGDALPTIEALADWLAAFMVAAEIADAALVGHSMGALAALEAAARHPARVRALALLGIAEKMPVHPELQAAAEAGGPLAPGLIVDWGFGRAAHLGGHPEPGLWVTGAARRILEAARPGVLATDLAACNAYGGAKEAAARADCPVLLILGAEDRMTPARGARPLAAALARAETLVLDDCGHMIMAEQPDAVLDALYTVI